MSKPALMALAALMVAVTAMPVMAAPLVAQQLRVDGSVPTRCLVSPVTALGLSNSAFTSNGTGGELVLGVLVDSNALTRGAAATLRIAITCTGAHDLTIADGGGLTNQTPGTPADGFSGHADYTLTANWGPATQTVTTSGSSVSLDLSQSTARAGDLDITFTLSPGKGPMTSGTYSDEILVQINAR